MNWIENLKDGDTVIVRQTLVPDRVEMISRRTPQYLWVGTTRFNLNGDQTGHTGVGHRQYLVEATPEALNKVAEEKRHRQDYFIIRKYHDDMVRGGSDDEKYWARNHIVAQAIRGITERTGVCD